MRPLYMAHNGWRDYVARYEPERSLVSARKSDCVSSYQLSRSQRERTPSSSCSPIDRGCRAVRCPWHARDPASSRDVTVVKSRCPKKSSALGGRVCVPHSRRVEQEPRNGIMSWSTPKGSACSSFVASFFSLVGLRHRAGCAMVHVSTNSYGRCVNGSFRSLGRDPGVALCVGNLTSLAVRRLFH
jgi:hypothetical protein